MKLMQTILWSLFPWQSIRCVFKLNFDTIAKLKRFRLLELCILLNISFQVNIRWCFVAFHSRKNNNFEHEALWDSLFKFISCLLQINLIIGRKLQLRRRDIFLFILSCSIDLIHFQLLNKLFGWPTTWPKW